MGLRHNPITYVILSNGLLWGLPLAIIQMQALVADRGGQVAETAQVRTTSLGDDLMVLESIIQPEHMTQLTPLDSTSAADPAATGPAASDPAATNLVSLTNPPAPLPADQAPAQAASAAALPILQPDLFTQLKGADGLGGPITLASRKAPLVPTAVRAERLQWERSNDALAALPLHWRDSLRQELGKGVRVSQAATVRLPVRELAERQEVPVIINDQGVVEGLVEPRHQRTREAVEIWAARQQPAEPGTVQVLLVAAEPLPPATEPLPPARE
jgi:hypothetical protein